MQRRDAESAYGWGSGPPKSESESWNYERRSELLSVSSVILQSQVLGAMRREDWLGGDGEMSGVNAVQAVSLAKALIDEVDRVRPKL